MIIASFTSASPSTLADLWAPTNIPAPADPLVPTGLILFPHTGLPVIQDMTKPFFIGKLVTAVNHTTAQMYTKDTIWIGNIPFASLDKAWQYMLEILDDE